MKTAIKELEGESVNWVSINTVNPMPQVFAEVKRYEMDYPVYSGYRQDINRSFRVRKLPRLIFVKKDGTVHKDVEFMRSEEIIKEINNLLKDAKIE